MKNSFVLALNDVSGLSADFLREHGIVEIPSHMVLGDKDIRQEFSSTKDYFRIVFPDEKMFNGEIHTSCASPGEVKSAFVSVLKAGKDVLYLHMPKSISSGTSNAARFIAEELSQEFPERKIIVIDAHTMSWGMGLLIRELLEANPETIEEAKSWLFKNRDSIAHIFTVSNLDQFIKTGRANFAKAKIGSMLGVQPYMELIYNNHGEKELTVLENLRHPKCLKKIVAETASRLDWETDPRVYVTYGAESARPDAETIARRLKELCAEQEIVVEVIFDRVVPMIINHTGPSVISIHFREKN